MARTISWNKYKTPEQWRGWFLYKKKHAPGKECYCHNCRHKISIDEEKYDITVHCNLFGGRILVFTRHTRGANTKVVCWGWEA